MLHIYLIQIYASILHIYLMHSSYIITAVLYKHELLCSIIWFELCYDVLYYTIRYYTAYILHFTQHFTIEAVILTWEVLIFHIPHSAWYLYTHVYIHVCVCLLFLCLLARAILVILIILYLIYHTILFCIRRFSSTRQLRYIHLCICSYIHIYTCVCMYLLASAIRTTKVFFPHHSGP